MDIITAIIALVITGIGVGFASGLLGVGGCFIMIPVQYWVYTAMGISSDIAIKVAFGTNLFVVLPTALSGAYGHTKKGAVRWKAGVVLGVTGAVGAVIGSTIAAHLPASILTPAFGLAILAGGVRMLTAKPPKIEEEPEDNPWVWAVWGFPLGIVTGIIGIGGGVLMVPVMVLALRFKMHEAVGTSTALMIFTSIGGLLGYIYNGISAGIFGAYPIGHLIGYVNPESWLSLAATSVPMAQVGVRTAHRLPAKQLRYVFIAVMIYMGLKMIGVFGWLGLPI
ncbi:MAG: sulfite exporter TauE/SafE family protein [Candidatus Syntropharchaeia archaeon]